MAHVGIAARAARAVGRGRGLVDSQSGGLFPWVPVCLGLGIGLYFILPTEPDWPVYMGLVAAVGAALGVMVLYRVRAPLLLALILVASGVLLAGQRAHSVAAPVLEGRFYGAVEGRIVKIDRSRSDKLRLTLDRVVLERRAPDETPARVRLSLHGAQDWLEPKPGQVIAVTGHLSPPQGPVEPGGFDFRQLAWFQQLGAVGYTRTPAILIEPSGRALAIDRLRATIARHMIEVMPGETGAFAAAITTGDRSGIGQRSLDNLRASNLAHLLAISGLHMALLTGVVFGGLRLGLAAVPAIALEHSVKNWAAVGALAAAAAYLALSGGNVATQRAFVMVSVVLIGVLAGRRAMTMRAVAVAAIIVLVLRPEALMQAGFQMSFAATAALVAVFRLLRDRAMMTWRGALGWALSLVLSSAIAGAATAPFGAAHFNQVSQFGLLANVLSVPMMGLVIVPGAVLAAVLAPVGLDWVGLWIMAPAIEWILMVAAWVAGMEGATVAIPSPSSVVLPMIAIGALFAMLWRGPWALLGGVPVVLAFGIWVASDRPDVLIDASGGLVGVMGPEGRALSKPKGQGFAAEVWLENDGDPVDQVAGAERPGFVRGKGVAVAAFAGMPLTIVSGRGAAERAVEACAAAGFVVTTQEIPAPSGCLMFDRLALERSGSVALVLAEGGAVEIVTSAARAGRRLWTDAATRDQ